EGAIRFFEAAGATGALELVAEELLELIHAGTAPEAIALVCDSIDRWRAPLETVLGTIGVPYAIEERPRLAKTAFGHALLSLLRFVWLGGARKELFAFLRSPYSGLSRGSVDFVEGRLRGRAVHTAARVEEEAERLRGAPVPALMRVRTGGLESAFLLGLEEGALPRRSHGSPFLDDDRRRTLGRRLERPDSVSRDRYLFYTACTRVTRRLYLVREAATDEGSPREPSPFWEEVTSLFSKEDVGRWTRRRALSALTWPLEAAPTDRERLRALAALSVADEDAAAALAEANGWVRRLGRARRAFERPTRLRNPALLESLRSRGVFGATELERFAD